MKNEKLEQWLGLAALGLVLIGCFVVMRPFLSALMWSGVLGFTLWPVYRRLLGWMGNRRTLAALVTTSTIALVLVVPFVVLGVTLADDARALGTATRKWAAAGPPAPPEWVERIPLVGASVKTTWIEFGREAASLLQQASPPEHGVAADAAVSPEASPAPPPASFAQSSLARALKKLLSWARGWLPKVGLAIGGGIVEVLLSVFLTFFIFRDGVEVANRLTTAVNRIAGDRGHHLLTVAGSTVRGVVYGILGTAIVQGGLAAVGFLVAGVPGATLLGLVTFFLSPVPVGPPLVWIPAVIWLFNQGSTGWGIFMLVWGLGVSSIDNLVKPWLISQGSNLPFILIFFGVLGGAFAFGIIGVFLGPTLLAVAYRLIEEWSATRREPAEGAHPG
jgi:predicted PurR-regulated permease PerM